jgi:hypothetical protein
MPSFGSVVSAGNCHEWLRYTAPGQATNTDASTCALADGMTFAEALRELGIERRADASDHGIQGAAVRPE